MVTPEAARPVIAMTCFYLGPLPNGTATEQVLRSVSAGELATHPLVYRPQRVKADDPSFVPYQGVWRSFTFEHDGQMVTDRALVVWSAGKQRLDEQKRKTCLKRLSNSLDAVQRKLNTLRYKRRAHVEQRLAKVQESNPARGLVDVELKGEDNNLQLTFRINRQRLAAAQALDGRYALATSAAHLDADQALRLFKGQDGVERRIRDAKGLLVMHPLFVRTDRRIEGLVFITLLALLVRAILERTCRQRGLVLSSQRLFQGFANLQAVDVVWSDGSRQRLAAELSAFQAAVIHTLGWPAPEHYAGLTPLER